MPLDRRGLLAFPFLGGLLVEFPPAQLGEDAGFLAGALEAAQRGIEILVLTDTDTRHREPQDLGKGGRAF